MPAWRAVACAVALSPFVLAGMQEGAGEPSTRALQAAARYLDEWETHLGGVVLEESYLQSTSGGTRGSRRLRSDLALIADRDIGWVEFRDVFEVDRRAVRDREDRIVSLFASPAADAVDQARRVVAEGARFNLEPPGIELSRTVNLPLGPLRFLRGSAQARSRFERQGRERLNGREAEVLRFREVDRPRLIGTPDHAAATGRFWIEPGFGRPLRAELALTTRVDETEVQASIRVDYHDTRLGLWLPKEMRERYVIRRENGVEVATITGQADYDNVRRFEVVVEERTGDTVRDR